MMVFTIAKARTCRKIGFALIALAMALVIQSPSRISAQTVLGTVTGLITDASGAVIPSAQVTLTETATGIVRKVATNPEGHYTFADIPAGTYIATVEKTGFKTVTSSPIILGPAKTIMFSSKLEVGSTTAKVEVTATPPTLNTSNGQISTTLTNNELINLPINSRGASAFRTIVASNYDYGAIGGMRENFGYYNVDGISAMAPAWGAWSGPTFAEFPMEAVSEFKIDENNTSAAYQDDANLSVISKSGTNTLHGSLYFTETNNAFNARNFFATSKAKGPREHDVGGSLGGPVVIPHLYNGRDKTFFFTDYERAIYPAAASGGSIITTVPTLKMRQGDFSDLCSNGFDTNGVCLDRNPTTNAVIDQIYSPFTGQPYAGNVITDPLSSVSQGIQSLFPEPNAGPSNNLFNNFNALVSNASYNYQIFERVDHQLTSKDNLSYRLVRAHNNENRYGGLPTEYIDQFRNTTNMFLSWTHTFGPAVVNEARVAFQRDASWYHGTSNGTQLVQQWGLQGLHLPSNDIMGLPQVNFQNFQNIFEYTTTFWAHNTIDYLDNLTWIKGKHQLTIGATIWRNIMNSSDGAYKDFGVFGFNGFATGYDYADFILGLPHTAERYTRIPNRYNRDTQLAFYGQDRWAVTPKLTLNFGLRWQKMTAPVDKNGMRFAYDPTTGQLVVPNQTVLDTLVSPLYPPVPIVTASAAGYPANSLVTTPSDNLAPNFGFAYRPFNNDRTVIRGAYSISYSPLYWPLLDPFQSGPFNSDENFLNSITNGTPVFAFPDPFPGSQTAVLGSESISGVTVHPSGPYTQQWNLTVEHQFPFQMVAHVTYRGNRTLQLLYGHDLNTPPPSPNPNNVNVFYSNPDFYSITFYNNGGSQMGNMLDVGVERKFTSGLTFQAGYAWARSLTDMFGGDVAGFPEDPYNFRRDWGPGSDPVPASRFTTSGIYELPFGSGKRFGSTLPSFARKAFGNWMISWVAAFQSGLYNTPYQCGYDTSNTRTYCIRPDAVSNWQLADPTINGWYNVSAFSIPGLDAQGNFVAPGRFGTASNGMVIGPGIANLDFGVFKYFTLHERARLQIRMTATNFFNHPNFSNPNMNILSSNAGRIGGLTGFGVYAGPRTIQLGARIEF